MEEIAKLVLSAPALNVALLCVLAALGLLWYRDNRKKAEANGNGSAFTKRAEMHFQRGHQMANDMGIVTLRVDRLERDMSEVKAAVQELRPKFASVESSMNDLKDRVGDMSEKLDLVLQKLLRD